VNSKNLWKIWALGFVTIVLPLPVICLFMQVSLYFLIPVICVCIAIIVQLIRINSQIKLLACLDRAQFNVQSPQSKYSFVNCSASTAPPKSTAFIKPTQMKMQLIESTIKHEWRLLHGSFDVFKMRIQQLHRELRSNIKINNEEEKAALEEILAFFEDFESRFAEINLDFDIVEKIIHVLDDKLIRVAIYTED